MKDALVIVAHPDDETIWMGGMILKNPSWSWTILSLCRANDKDRAPKFKKVCEKLNAVPIISDLDDEILNDLEIEFVKDYILKNIPGKNFDVIYTHGQNGEYGHKRHKEVNKAVISLINEDKLKAKEVYSFAYYNGNENVPGLDLKIAIPNENSGTIINLNAQEYANKIDLVTDIYRFDKKSFEALCCNKKEAFRKIK